MGIKEEVRIQESGVRRKENLTKQLSALSLLTPVF
jgi:hypothetical protein